MKRSIFLTVISALSLAAIWYTSATTNTTLSLRIGESFEEVVRDSTFPVKGGAGPGLDATGFGWTYVTEPAVTIRFNDQTHGFTLPPTTFAAVTYEDGRAVTLATSPMLKKASFETAVSILDSIQQQLQRSGWQPMSAFASEWFDLTPNGQKRLHARLQHPGWSVEHHYSVPGKYQLTLRLNCSSGCHDQSHPELYLIDIAVSQ